MTIEELKDLIDSTINENGTKAITGKALNLALNEITNAVAEAATTGGGGVKRLYVNSGGSVTNPEQLASNAALYTEIVTALTNDELPPQVGVIVSDGSQLASVISASIEYANSLVLIICVYGATPIGFSLSSDGNVLMGG